MLEEILPRTVAVASSREDIADVRLYPEEEAVVARAVDRRRREFATARACARTALAELGHEPQPILPGARGAPQWPQGIVGSITHCEGYRACALARVSDFVSVGVDAELNQPLPAGILGDIALPEERGALRDLETVSPDVCWDRLLFSIKEAVYKAWFPLTQTWLDFEEAAIAIDSAARSFAARLLVPGPWLEGQELRQFSGRWTYSGGFIFTAIAHPANPSTGELLD